jgi:hypothetical protein
VRRRCWGRAGELPEELVRLGAVNSALPEASMRMPTDCPPLHIHTAGVVSNHHGPHMCTGIRPYPRPQLANLKTELIAALRWGPL